MKKLYHICQKALAHIWKSFTTTVKQLKSRIIYILSLNNPQLNASAFDFLTYLFDGFIVFRSNSHLG